MASIRKRKYGAVVYIILLITQKSASSKIIVMHLIISTNNRISYIRIFYAHNIILSMILVHLRATYECTPDVPVMR